VTGDEAQIPAYDSWADYYDLTDADRTPFVSFYRGLVRDSTRSLLELGCGTGTIAIALAQTMAERSGSRGLRVVGVDESPAMLRVARSRAPELEWIEGDMRDPPVDGPFDLVICPFNTLQLLLEGADLSATFRAVRRLLAADGTFAFDLYQPNIEYLETSQDNRMARAVDNQHGERLEIREDTAYDDSSRVLTVDWRLVKAADPEAPPIATTRYFVRQYFPEDIDRALDEGGLRADERYGDFDRSQFGPAAKKQILVCSRT
jgi:SAM-dependent methyltransferase